MAALRKASDWSVLHTQCAALHSSTAPISQVLDTGYGLAMSSFIQGEHAREEAAPASGVATGNVSHISFEGLRHGDMVEPGIKTRFPTRRTVCPKVGM